MMKPLALIASLLAAGAGFAWVQEPSKPLVSNDFSEDTGGWTGIGGSAKLAIYHDPSLGAPTVGALRFNYAITKGDFNALLLPAAAGSLKTAKSIKFWVHTDASTLIAVAMQEEEGGRYVALVHAPKDTWQPVELSTSDFALAMDKGDPKDPNGKLDMDLVGGVIIADVSQFFYQIEQPGAKDLFAVKPGPHSLYLDDFSINTESLPPATTSQGEDVRIDSFVHPQLAWFGVGGVKLSRFSGTPLEGAGMKVEYHQTPGKPVLLTRSMMPWVLTQSKSISFDAASVQATKLIVQVEETEGGKYNATVDIPAGSQAKHFNIPFADFKAADDSKDPSGKLEVGKVKTLAFIEPSGIIEKADRDNTLWINNLIGVAGK